jgi:hypothetical protein
MQVTIIIWKRKKKKTYFGLVLLLTFLPFFLKGTIFNNRFKGGKRSGGVLRFTRDRPGYNANAHNYI